MRRGRWWQFAGSLLLLAGCASTPAATPTAAQTVVSAPGTTASESKLRVTVPALGTEVEAAPSAASAPTVTSGDAPAASSEPAPKPASTEAPPPVAGPATVAVELVDCDGCAVIATHAAVVAGLSAALITRDGRATLLSVDTAGAVIGILNVPYGAAFAPPADGQLACGTDGRCVVVAAQPDGRAILSAFELTSTGAWRDLSGAGGFVSASTKGRPVPLEDTLGVAIQVSDGATTVWTVLNWNGELFTAIGCTPDAEAPDLGQLSLASCLS